MRKKKNLTREEVAARLEKITDAFRRRLQALCRESRGLIVFEEKRKPWKREELYAAGLRELYRRFYYTYRVAFLKRDNEKRPIGLPPVRKVD